MRQLDRLGIGAQVVDGRAGGERHDRGGVGLLADAVRSGGVRRPDRDAGVEPRLSISLSSVSELRLPLEGSWAATR